MEWLSSYPEGMPAEIDPDAYSSLKELFMVSCEKFGTHVAYEHMGAEITFAQTFKLARDFAAFCQHKLDLQKGDCIGLMMPNMMQYPIALFGAWMAGLTVVNINPLYTPEEIIAQLSQIDVRCVVVIENFAKTLSTVKKTIAIPHVIVTGLGDMLGFPKANIANFIIKYVKRLVPRYSLATPISFMSVLSQGAECELIPVSLSGNDVALLQPTGGTTGAPKSAMLTHRNLVANVEQIGAWIRDVLVEGEEIIVTALPIYHIFSLVVNILLFMREGGTNILITDPRDISALIQKLQTTHFTLMTGVNTLYNAMTLDPGFKKCDFSSFKLAIAGGMPASQKVAEAVRAITGRPLIEGYGLTEASPVVSALPMTALHYDGSIGFPLPSTNVKILDDSGSLCPADKPGELFVQGPQVMKGYYKNSKETVGVLSKDGWLATGDVAVMSEKGVITLVDRKKDMIIVSGFNVYPNEVEAVILQMPEVLEAAVVGVPCKESGEAVKAVVVQKSGSLSVKDVIAHCHGQLAHYKTPRIIEFTDALPKNNVGKVLRKDLR